VRVTLQINLPSLSKGGQEKINAELPSYPSEGNFQNKLTPLSEGGQEKILYRITPLFE
jgi:hypothetical protein